MTTNEASRDKISRAQNAYSAADLSGDRADWDEYYALVEAVAWDQEIDVRAAFDLVENGPRIF